MNKSLILFAAILLPCYAWATVCPHTGSPGSAVYNCTTDTGNAETNGANLNDTFAVVDCGDTINVGAGVVYGTGLFGSSTFTLPFRNTTLCNMVSPNYITIAPVSTTTANVRVDPSQVSSMAVLRADGDGGSVITLPANSHHWKFVNCLFTDGTNINTDNSIINYLAGDDKVTVTIGTYPHHIWFDRSIFRPAEYASAGTDPFRSVAQGIVIEGQEIISTNSYFYEFQGVRTDTPTHSVTTVSNSTTPVMTTDNVNGHPLGDPLNAYGYGFTGNWTRLNGWNYAIPVSSTQMQLKKAIQFITVTGGTTATASEYYHRPHNLQVGDTVTISGVNYSGATGMNGAKVVTATPSAYEFSWAQTGVPNGSYCAGGESCLFQDASSGYFAVWDSTSAGAVTGTATWREAVPHNSYDIAVIAAPGPLRVVNNYLDAWFSSIFLGGGGSPTSHTATMSSVSATGATLSTVSGMRVGEIVAIQTPYTGYQSGWRTVKISTVNSGTGAVTWTPWGITGLATAAKDITAGTCSTSGTTVTVQGGTMYVGFQDFYSGVPVVINGTTYTVSFINSNAQFTLTTSAGTQTNVACNLAMLPSSGGTAQWDGVPGTAVEVRGNYLHRSDYGYPNSGVCKAMHEMKIVNGGLWDGNVYDGFTCVTLGLTQRNQTGASPWSSLRDLTFSNNLALNSERIAQMLLDDDLATTVRKEQAPAGSNYGGGNNHFLNNLFLDLNTDPHYENSQEGMDVDDLWAHNTFYRPAATGILLPTACDNSRVPPYGYINGQFVNNLFKFGFYGFNAGACYPSQSTLAVNNILVDDQGVGNATVNGNAPNNLYAANNAAVGFSGTCDASGADWKNCGLSNSSTFKGGASDGGDPAADISAIRDRTADKCTSGCGYGGFSEQEGLLVFNSSTNTMDITWTPGNTTSSPVFTIVNSIGSCAAHLYTNLARTTEVADTVSSSACNRAGNTVIGSQVTFVFGHNTALTPNSTYYYSITDGSRVMVGSFRTSGSGVAPTITTTCPLPAGKQGVAYSQTLTATGTTPITWSISSGALPTGLNLVADTITGTPTGSGTSSFSIQALNSVGNSTNGPISCSLSISPTPQPPSVKLSGKAVGRGVVVK